MVLLSGDGKAAGEGRSPAAAKHLAVPPSEPAGPGAAAPEGSVVVGSSPAAGAERSRRGSEGDGGGGAEGGSDEDDAGGDYEEYEDFSDLPDTRSIASDDSFYPPRADGDSDDGDDWSLGESDSSTGSPEALTLFRACCTNNAVALRAIIRQGPEEKEAKETDRNKRTGLIVACYQGFVDIVIALAQCPHIDVNWQDNEGNTALITAAQAGANIYATDPGRGFTSQEWACFTGRIESAYLMQRLMDKPCAEQFCDHYELEWPKLKELLAKAAERKTCLQKISEGVRSIIASRGFKGPEDDGVLDHMVRVTTSLRSSFVAIACRTVCPGSPPGIGKRRPAVQEIFRKQRAKEIKSMDSKDHFNSYEKLFQNSRVMLVSKKKERRASLQPFSLNVPQVSIVVPRKSSLLPLHLLRRSSVRPGFVIPKVRINKAPPPTFQPEKVRRKSSAGDGAYLQIPKWRYKELKEERKKAEEEEKKKAEAAQKQKQGSPVKSKT
uniref:ankyrin repeat domain-containing protein 33B isoform X3 n=1 Tax=Podarcis muralis TaxID=64176 RepID=UPI00109F4839|nr:ankyrin repeat domain-containing protein 33B isoform X3 [Podarcis muralis]